MKLDRKAISRLLSVAVALCIALAAIELARRFRAGAVNVSPGWVCVSGLFLAIGYVGQAWGFHRLVLSAAQEPPARAVTAELFFRGMLARYLPGKVGIPAVRMAAASSVSVGTAFMAASVVLESLAWLASGFLLTIVLSLGPWAPQHLSRLWAHPLAKLTVAASLLGALVMASLEARFYPRLLLKFLRLEARRGPLLPPVLMLSTGTFWVGTACASATLAFALGANQDAALLAAVAGLAAPLVGFLALPVPAGLGVREAVLVMALSSSLGESGALAFGLVSRAVGLGTELLLWLTSRWVRARWERARPLA